MTATYEHVIFVLTVLIFKNSICEKVIDVSSYGEHVDFAVLSFERLTAMHKKMIIKNKILLLSTLYFLLSTLIGCGYTTRSLLPPHIKSIHVPPFENKIDFIAEHQLYYAGLEIKITKAIRERFSYDGGLRLSNKEDSDATLKGELIRYYRQSLRYTELDEVKEYRLSVVVNLTFIDNKENKVLWKINNLIGDSTYHATGPLAKSEGEALGEAISDLARRVVRRTIEIW